MDIPELDRLLDNAYTGDLASRSIEEIRAMRAESQAVETGLSYVRRLAQGRLDIVAADLRRRREGGDAPDLHSLVEHLPEILGERVHAPGVGRLPTLMAPRDDEVTRQLTSRLDAIVDANTLGALEQLLPAHSVTEGSGGRPSSPGSMHCKLSSRAGTRRVRPVWSRC